MTTTPSRQKRVRLRTMAEPTSKDPIKIDTLRRLGSGVYGEVWQITLAPSREGTLPTFVVKVISDFDANKHSPEEVMFIDDTNLVLEYLMMRLTHTMLGSMLALRAFGVWTIDKSAYDKLKLIDGKTPSFLKKNQSTGAICMEYVHHTAYSLTIHRTPLSKGLITIPSFKRDMSEAAFDVVSMAIPLVAALHKMQLSNRNEYRAYVAKRIGSMDGILDIPAGFKLHHGDIKPENIGVCMNQELVRMRMLLDATEDGEEDIVVDFVTNRRVVFLDLGLASLYRYEPYRTVYEREREARTVYIGKRWIPRLRNDEASKLFLKHNIHQHPLADNMELNKDETREQIASFFYDMVTRQEYKDDGSAPRTDISAYPDKLERVTMTYRAPELTAVGYYTHSTNQKQRRGEETISYIPESLWGENALARPNPTMIDTYALGFTFFEVTLGRKADDFHLFMREPSGEWSDWYVMISRISMFVALVDAMRESEYLVKSRMDQYDMSVSVQKRLLTFAKGRPFAIGDREWDKLMRPHIYRAKTWLKVTIQKHDLFGFLILLHETGILAMMHPDPIVRSEHAQPLAVLRKLGTYVQKYARPPSIERYMGTMAHEPQIRDITLSWRDIVSRYDSHSADELFGLGPASPPDADPDPMLTHLHGLAAEQTCFNRAFKNFNAPPRKATPYPEKKLDDEDNDNDNDGDKTPELSPAVTPQAQGKTPDEPPPPPKRKSIKIRRHVGAIQKTRREREMRAQQRRRIQHVAMRRDLAQDEFSPMDVDGSSDSRSDMVVGVRAKQAACAECERKINDSNDANENAVQGIEIYQCRECDKEYPRVVL